jgi:sorbitol-specific phosphotransferase system component IIC
MKKILYTIGCVLLVFMITNPGDSSFVRFLGEQEFSKAYRKANYITCGVYSVDFVTANSGYHVDYFAILGRFYKINK